VVIRIVQALMSVFTAFFVYLLTQKITKKNAYFKNIPLISFGLTLLCPFLILFVSILFSETLFSFLIVLSVLFFIYAMDGPTKYYFYSGIFIGLAFMTRPVIFAFPICMGFAFFFANHSNPKKFLIRIGVYLLPFFTIWGIWIARNYIAFDRFIPMTAQDGVFLLVGTYPPNRYENDLPTEAKKETGTFVFIPESERIEVVKNMRKKAFQRILDYPFQYVLYCIQRIPILWFSSYSHYISINEEFGCLLKNFTKNWYNNIKNMQLLTIKFFLLLINIFYLITGAIGMLLLSKKWSTVFPLYILIFYFTLIHLPLGFANARYVIPIYPFFLIFCSFGMFYIFQKFKREKIGIF
jgi:4-amino-4-deoxy-L-arabinose transferase-like glycosyltransferase